jgi:hypothetical protein
MAKLLDPFRFLLTSLAGWMNQHHLKAIDHLREENRALHETTLRSEIEALR